MPEQPGTESSGALLVTRRFDASVSGLRSEPSERLRPALAAVLTGALVFVLPLIGFAARPELAALSLVMLALASAVAPRSESCA